MQPKLCVAKAFVLGNLHRMIVRALQILDEPVRDFIKMQKRAAASRWFSQSIPATARQITPQSISKKKITPFPKSLKICGPSMQRQYSMLRLVILGHSSMSCPSERHCGSRVHLRFTRRYLARSDLVGIDTSPKIGNGIAVNFGPCHQSRTFPIPRQISKARLNNKL